MTREEIIENLANEIDEKLTVCELAEPLIDCDYCHLKKKNGTCNIRHHIAERQISIVEKAQTDLLKEFVEYLKLTKKYQAIDEDTDTRGISWGKRYTFPNHQFDKDLETFLEERK